MRHYDYLIVGGGMAADAAARGIRELDVAGALGILSADIDPPYARPALSKRLWTDMHFPWHRALLDTQQATGADLQLQTRVTRILRTDQQVVTAAGETIGYQRLLLATGLVPRTLPDAESGTVIYYRSAEDYRRLMSLSLYRDSFLVIGGGYIGAELAAALVGHGRRVTLVLPGQMLGDTMFPADICQEYHQEFADAGVRLLTGYRVRQVRRSGPCEDGLQVGVTAVLDDGREITADAAVAGLGAVPDLDMAREAGLSVDDGIIVDAHLRTSDPSIWAAGDIARYRDAVLGPTRVEHVDNAQTMGRAAGRAMAGDPEPYDYTPYIYSRVLGIDWQAIGKLDPSLETLTTTMRDGGRVVAYIRDGRTVGVLLWQIADGLDAARSLLTRRIESPADLESAVRR